MKTRVINVNGVTLSNDLPFGLLCGPCQIESRQHAIDIAGSMVEITKDLNIPYIFKASFDKANRTSINGARGVGIDEGLRTFDEIKKLYNNIPIVTDIHEKDQCAIVAEHVDML
jgi:2-dehydro-3-deoxyphosphooctonate aldolase (KDO 8-P synthase)